MLLATAQVKPPGVKKDSVKAVKWYKKAAAKQDPKALYNLALCYEYGDGVTRSHRWARYYFSKAAALGHKSAGGKIKALSAAWCKTSLRWIVSPRPLNSLAFVIV
jgi:TPR repeat protein